MSLGPHSTTLTAAQIASLREQLESASRRARALPGTKALREQLHELITAENGPTHLRPRRKATLSLSWQKPS